MATLKLTALEKTYSNGYRALHGIDLEVDDGEMVVVVGPSGCGKSTLLRCLAGLETISDGELCIAAQRVNELEPAARDIAMVFQNYALYPHMSVADNMGYALKNLGVPKHERRRRVTEVAGLLGLEALLERKPGQLSGGQRQRVAMGRAIVREPRVFLFDEPLSNLDAALRVQMRLEIRRLQKRLGITSVYVTHDQVEAMTLADRLVIMNDGRIEQVGTPLELYARPRTRFVAGFIGSPAMNFLDARIIDGAIAFADDSTLPAAAKGDGPVSLGIRPEHLRVTTADETDLTVQVEMVEPLGADTLAYCRVSKQSSPLVIRLDGGVEIAEGQLLAVKLPPSRWHLFDQDTGKRLALDDVEDESASTEAMR